MQSFIDKLTEGAARCFSATPRIVVAVSGGPDSQVLLDALACSRKHLGVVALWAVGIDHGLRATARDELKHAEALATQHNIPFTAIAVEVSRRGNRLGQARRARYAALVAFAQRVGADAIAVAHTATDQLETILLHLVRGSALRGVSGMHPRRGLLARPLLGITRDDIIAYARARQLRFATDPSNADPQRARAQLRATVMPALKLLNAQSEVHAARFALAAQADERCLQSQAQRALKRALRALDALALAPLTTLPDPVARRVLRTWLRRHRVRVDAKMIETLWAARRLRRFSMSCGDAEVSFERQTFWCARPSYYDEELPMPGELGIKEFQVRLSTALNVLTNGAMWQQFVAPAAESVAFDADRLHFGLRIRAWQHGDRLQPLGNRGHIKVGDLFTNSKIPRPLRASWPMLVDGEEVLWVVGLRRGSGAPLSEKTQRVVTVNLGGALPWSAS